MKAPDIAALDCAQKVKLYLNVCYSMQTVERIIKYNLKATEHKVLSQPQPRKYFVNNSLLRFFGD